MINQTILWIIIGSSLVTVVPRGLPFILTKKLVIPEKVRKWLSFVPICIFTSLIVQELINKTDKKISIDWMTFIVLIPTILVYIKTKSMIVTVGVGVVCMALIRLVTGFL